MAQSVIEENARMVLDQDYYEKRYYNLIDRYEEKKNQYDELTDVIADKQAKS